MKCLKTRILHEISRRHYTTDAQYIYGYRLGAIMAAYGAIIRAPLGYPGTQLGHSSTRASATTGRESFSLNMAAIACFVAAKISSYATVDNTSSSPRRGKSNETIETNPECIFLTAMPAASSSSCVSEIFMIQ